MNKKILIMLLAALFMIAYACKKGDTGAQGLQGVQGIQGVKGENGTMIYSGTTLPAAILGANGDFYIHLPNGNLYGPKANGEWGSATSLRGATGASGTAGSKILSGVDVPAANLGVIGDYYLRTSTNILYGPKTITGWGTGLNLKGETGTANVIYSDWMSFLKDQRDTIIDGTNLKVNHISAPKLTQTIIDRGVILVYWRFQNTVFQLPYTSDAGAGTGPSKSSTISFVPKTGIIYITRYTHDNTASIGFGSVQFRYVLIPGGVSALASIAPGSMANYQTLKTALKMQD